MNTLIFKQKQGFSHNEFMLTNDTLTIRQSTIAEYKEWRVRLEDIGRQTVVEKDTSFMKQGLYLSLGLFSILFVLGNVADHSSHLSTWVWMLLSVIWAWFATVVYLSPLNNKLILGSGSEVIEFLSDRPSELEVQNFVDEIHRRQAIILKRKYGIDSGGR